jgi:hypothetical protein
VVFELFGEDGGKVMVPRSLMIGKEEEYKSAFRMEQPFGMREAWK